MKIDRNSLTRYVEYKMIKDYSNVVFYFVNYRNYFSLDKRISDYHNDLVISALPGFCNLQSAKCLTRFINPTYLIKVHQEFVKSFPEYLFSYAYFSNDLSEFVNNHDSFDKNIVHFKYSQKFYRFLNNKNVSYSTQYLLRGLPCFLIQKLNNKIQTNFNMTKLNNVYDFYNLINSSYENMSSTNDRKNTNLEFLCKNTKTFKFLKLFCFLKIDYIDDMLRVIGQESDKISSIKTIVEEEKNVIIKYLLKTKDWIERLLSMNYIDYKYNESRIFKELDAFYSQIPKITFKGADLSNEIYSISKNHTMSLKCKD